MYATKINKQTRKKILENYDNHLKNMMDLEDGENELRKKKLQLSGGFLPMLLPLMGLLSGKGNESVSDLQKEGYARDEGVVPVMRNKYKLQVVKPEKKTGGFISKLGIPIVSDLAGAIGLGKTGAGVSGAGHTKKTSSWIEHVKNYAKAHNISYKKALTEAKPSYKK
jgi:hypothetical protein